jgi:hypothetical protein
MFAFEAAMVTHLHADRYNSGCRDLMMQSKSEKLWEL